eukprot:TRINITY_DN4067_c0_g1_i1.p1 TRINITY_DN4067_c0_g1~~TRINITY_DN4067_c0_g1_i1.p1  ORF type:complete len:624 (-),score=147.93 TRINITY_DN4067_c0_g1_i1:58-1929(-)
MQGILQVVIVSAHNLVAADMNGASDPYCKLSINSMNSLTSIIKNSLNPRWEETFHFVVADRESQKLHIKVMDHDLVGSDDPLGEVDVDLTNLPEEDFRTVERDLTLVKTKSGTLKIRLRFLDTSNTKENKLSQIVVDATGFSAPKESKHKFHDSTKRPASKALQAAKEGIPFPYKLDFWKKFLLTKFWGAKEENLELHWPEFDHSSNDSGACNYQELLKIKPNQVTADQIEKDLHRTFPYHPVYQRKEGRSALRNVCTAFSIKNPHIGYCQSMNFLIAYYLLFMDEEEAFHFFTFVVENFFAEYYTRNMELLQVDHEVLEVLLKEHLPHLANHLTSVGMIPSLYVTSWLMCLFSTTLPFITTVRVWDYIFLGGPSFTIIISLAVLKCMEKELLKADDFIAVNTQMKKLTESMCWSDLVPIINSYASLDEKVSDLRKKFTPEVQKRISERQMAQLKTTNFKVGELEEIREEFLKVAKNGVVTIEQFSEVLQQCPCFTGTDINDPDVKKRVFTYYDTNNDGTIDFREFCVGLSSITKGSTKEKVQFIFKVFDTDKSNNISKEEMIQMFSYYYKQTGFSNYLNLAEKQTEEIFSMHDSNSDNTLNLEEFIEACDTQPLFQQVLRSL